MAKELTPLHVVMKEKYSGFCEVMQEYKTPTGFLGLYRVQGNYYSLALLVQDSLTILLHADVIEGTHMDMVTAIRELVKFSSAERIR
jgi:hypothetical protein